MKYTWFMLAAVSFMLSGCSSSTSQRVDGDQPMELGWVGRSTLLAPKYHPFEARFDTVQADPAFIGLIKVVQQDVETLVFFGTWCGDSKREVPHFFRIADAAGIDSARIRLFAVDRSKKSQDGLTERYGIERVPTFVFFKHGEEIGRITEKPQSSLEADMLAILASAQAK